MNPNKQICIANLKNCPIKRGGCGYHYQAGDARWQDGGKCPVCGFPRRCSWNVRPDLNGNRDTCYMHGAGSYRKGRVGGQPPQLDIPSNVLERAKIRESDPTLLEMRTQIAALANRAEEIMQKIDLGESSRSWQELHRLLPSFTTQARQLWKNYQRALNVIQSGGNSPENVNKVKDTLYAIEDLLTGPDLDTLLAVIEKGRNITLANKDLAETVLNTMKLIDSQRKWELDKRYFISATEALALPLRVYQLIEETPMEPEVRNALVAGLEVEVLKFQRVYPERVSQTPMMIEGNQKDSGNYYPPGG